jgi:hypothetical protein
LQRKIKISGSSRVTLLLATAIAFADCCSLTKSETSSRLLQLENSHTAFIDTYTIGTPGGTPTPWDEASFQAKVQTINQSFTSAASDVGISSCPPRKQFLENSATLFKNDAAFIETHHSISPSFSQHKKEQLKQNYDSFLAQ